MKKFFWSLSILFAAAPSFAAPSIHYDLSINNNVYNLVVQEVLPASTSFSQVAANLRNPDLFKAFNPSITELVRSNQTGSDYLLSMTVTKLKMPSVSVFKCHEDWDVGSWNRHCVLQTQLADGGKFMTFKIEDSACKLNPETQETHCTLSYAGQMKDITALGITLMKAPQFAVKAKYEAMKHFAHIWLYSFADGSSIEQTIEKYKLTELSTKIENIFSTGTAQAKAQGSKLLFKANVQYP